jgi:tetratricopeptide (TPR) repeat protein
MKKSFLFAILLLFAAQLLMAQRPSCLNDPVYALVSLGDVLSAKRDMDKCFPGNEGSADAWLVRANVLIRYYNYELDRKNKDPKYTIKMPDAIIIANESFYKALELKPDIKTDYGLIDPKEGQLLSADAIRILAANVMDKKNYTEAIKLLNMVIRSYRVDPRGNAFFLAAACLDLADCYKFLGDNSNYKKSLLDAAKLNVALPDIYLNLYDIYIQEKDTVKCGEILNQARKIVPDSLSINIKGYELNYFSMIGDTVKLKEAALKMYEQYKNNVGVINIVAGYLVNNKEYLLADDVINAGLAINPNDFDLVQQMTYRYYFEAVDFDNIKAEKIKLKKWMEAKPYLEKANEILGSAVIWAEKAYKLNQDDSKHNIMYLGILVRLEMPIPDGLQEKVDSYKQK